MNDFFDVIRRFLLDYLPKQRCLSENTILSFIAGGFLSTIKPEMGKSHLWVLSQHLYRYKNLKKPLTNPYGNSIIDERTKYDCSLRLCWNW